MNLDKEGEHTCYLRFKNENGKLKHSYNMKVCHCVHYYVIYLKISIDMCWCLLKEEF